MVYAAGLDSTAIAWLGGDCGMTDTVERLVFDNDGKGRHAAGSEGHFALTIRAGSHAVDTSSPV